MTPAHPYLAIAVTAMAIATTLFIIILWQKRHIAKLEMHNCSTARAFDQAAAFIDAMKAHAPELKGDRDIQKLAADVLAGVEEHRRSRAKLSPNADLLIRDLQELAGPRGPRDDRMSASRMSHA